MIAKVSRGNNFLRLFTYLLQESKKAKVIYANLAEAYGDSSALIAKFENHAALHQRVKKPVYHLSLSPAYGDNLSLKDWFDSVQSIMSALNVDKHHQAVAFMHQDTYFDDGKPKEHIHLVVNAVSDYGKAANFLLRLFKNRTLLKTA